MNAFQAAPKYANDYAEGTKAMFTDLFATATNSGTGNARFHNHQQANSPVANRIKLVGNDISSLLRESRTAVKRWYHFRRAVRELNRLDDGGLSDIGIHRSEIEVTAYAIAEQATNARPHWG